MEWEGALLQGRLRRDELPGEEAGFPEKETKQIVAAKQGRSGEKLFFFLKPKKNVEIKISAARGEHLIFFWLLSESINCFWKQPFYSTICAFNLLKCYLSLQDDWHKNKTVKSWRDNSSTKEQKIYGQKVTHYHYYDNGKQMSWWLNVFIYRNNLKWSKLLTQLLLKLRKGETRFSSFVDFWKARTTTCCQKSSTWENKDFHFYGQKRFKWLTGKEEKKKT